MNNYQVFSVHNTLISAHNNAAAALKHALIYQHTTGQPAHVEQVPAQPIGAWGEIEYIPEGDRLTVYFSFAGLNEDEAAQTDGAGVPDDRIFYYCDGGEAEMIQLKQSEQEFKVLSYELEYKGDL